MTNQEPTNLGAVSISCGGNIRNTICDDLASDPLIWIDNQKNFQIVGLNGIEGWENLAPDRWRFRLREGVTFHNGAPWKATQAKFWIDFFGDEATNGHFNSNDFSLHGVIRGEIVDAMTLDVKCGLPCPILPRTTIYTKFQDVGWFEEASADDIERMTVGLGPYRIVEWRSGIEIELEAFEDYKPNPNTVFAKSPSIRRMFQIWRNLGPGPPNFASMQITAAPISTKTLDYSRQGYLRNSCFSRLSGICEDKLGKIIEEVNAKPTRNLRRQRLEAIDDHVHDHFHIVQGYHVVSIYGFSENLKWEPHHAPRIHANTMFFTQ